MRCALMSIALCASMKASTNLQTSVGRGRLLQNGQRGQWAVLFLLRRPWLLDYLCSNPPYLNSRNFWRPDRQMICKFLFCRISPGIDELVKKLKAKNIDVYLISGGFRQMINPVASILGIPVERIFANQLLFGRSGEFVGFDANEPTSRSGGKPTAVQQIRKAHGYKAMVMIGDGATDLEAKKPGGADLFICYGGVQLREGVAAKADWVVFNFADLINSLD
ncbi:Phosphoserine phosphatase, chloroplastic [Linum grandiflorum]